MEAEAGCRKKEKKSAWVGGVSEVEGGGGGRVWGGKKRRRGGERGRCKRKKERKKEWQKIGVGDWRRKVGKKTVAITDGFMETWYFARLLEATRNARTHARAHNHACARTDSEGERDALIFLFCTSTSTSLCVGYSMRIELTHSCNGLLKHVADRYLGLLN